MRPDVALNYLAQWLATCVNQMLRPAAQIGDGDLVNIEVKTLVERREYVTELHRPFGGFTTKPIRCTNYLAGFHASTRQQSAGDAGPMIATRIFVDRRCPAKLTPNNN